MKNKLKKVLKKFLTVDFYLDALARFLRFFIKRNPVGMFNKTFNQKHPYLAATISGILIVTIFLGSAYFLFLRGGKAEAGWWNDSWGYRKSIVVTNSSGSTLTDFQVKVLTNVDLSTDITNGKIQSSLNDLRFTNINGVLLPYWIEDTTTNSVDVWVKMPSIPTTGATVYFYYGNPSAVAYSDGNNVFLFFDDFSGSAIDTSKWTVQTGSPSVSGGELILNGQDGLFAGNYQIPENTVWEERSNPQSTGRTGGAIRAAQTSATGWVQDGGVNIVDILWWSNNSIYAEWNNGENGWYSGYSSGYAKYKIAYRPGNADTADYYYNDANKYTRSGSVTQNVYPVMYSYNGQSKFDWFFIRKYASTDPSSASPGTEEKGTGPVAYWSFDEGQGTTAQDSTANNLDGTLTNMSATSSPTSGWQTEDNCVSGKCLAFDGSNDYVDTSATTLSGTGAKTISAWFKTTASATYNVIYGEQWISAGYLGTVIYTNVAGNLVAKLGPDAQGVASLATPLTYNDGKWHHVSVAWDGTNSANGFVIYVDGVSVATATATNNAPLSGLLSGTTKIGSLSDATRSFNGKIDEVKVYKYARSAAQIKMDYNVGQTGSGGQEGTEVSIGAKSQKWMTDGLVGYWKMDEASWSGSSGEVIDASGNGNNGTAVSGATTGAGKFGNGGSFDGTNDTVSYTANSLHDVGTGSYAISVWAKPASVASRMVVAQKIDNSGAAASPTRNGWSMMLTSTQLELKLYGNSTTAHFQSSATTFSAGTWYHLVAVLNRSDNKVYFYSNGVLISTSDANAFAGANIADTNTGLYFGSNSNLGAYYNGILDEPRLYNRALSPKEISDLYNFAPGPVGWWKMDENSGGYAYDASGNSLTGTLTGSPTWTNGKYGGAVSFASNSQYIAMAADNSKLQTTTGTVCAWINPNATSSFHGIFSYEKDYAAGVYGYAFGVRAGNFAFLIGDNSGYYEQYTVSPVSTGVWTYGCLAFSPSNIKVYKNGLEVGSYTPTRTAQFYSGNTPRIGFMDNDHTYGFNGIIDDVKVYNYFRTQKQIVEDMSARGRSALGGNGQSQVGYWKFDEGQGGTAYNFGNGGSALNGTITGATWSNSGKFGKTLSFNGSSSYVDAGTTSSFSFIQKTATFAISSWIKLNDYTENRSQTIMGNTATRSENGFYFAFAGDSSDRFLFEGYNRSGSTYVFTGYSANNAIADNNWHHIVLTGDGSKVKLFVDGIQSGSDVSVGTLSTEDSSRTLNIGRYNYSTPGNYLNGFIDEPKIYSYGLTADEVKLDMNQGKAMTLGSAGTTSAGVADNSSSRAYCVPGDATTCNPPTGEWKMDEMSGGSANDTSGNGYAGTISGASWAQGKMGSGLQFLGGSEYISFSQNMSSLITNSSATIEAWYKPAGSPVSAPNSYSLPAIVSDYCCAGGYLGITRGNLTGVGDGIYFYNYSGGEQYVRLANYTVGQWIHLAWVHTGGYLYAYANGVLVGSIASGNTGSLGYTFRIGSAGTTGTTNGIIDQVKTFNYARSAAQIAWDYNRGGPVGWWRMDEGEGTTAYDYSGNANNGTLTNMDPPNDWVAGKINKALDFDGSNDWVNMGDPSSGVLDFDASSSLSVSLWANTNSLSRQSYMLGKEGSPGFYEFYKNSSGYPVFRVYDGTNEILVTSSQALATGTWYHVMGILDRSNNLLKVFINGTQTGSTSSAGLGSLANAISLGIGCYNGGCGSPAAYVWDGKLDDVRVYNYALTASQIKDLYNNGAVNFR